MRGDTTQAIAQAHIDHQDWCAGDIAEFLDIHPGTVKSLASRLQLKLPKESEKRAEARRKMIAKLKPHYVKARYAGQP